MFTVGNLYTREQIQTLLAVPAGRTGGNWDTGYTSFDGAFFVFANVGGAGRTGHDYANGWIGDRRLAWEAKSGSQLKHPQIIQLYGGQKPVHMFTRTADRQPFTYQGVAKAERVYDTTPVRFEWRLSDEVAPSMTADQIANHLQRMGFSVRALAKVYRCELDDLLIFLKRESESLILVVPPRFAERQNELTSIPGVSRPLPSGKLVHNANFRGLPLPGPRSPINEPGGLDFNIADAAALETFVGRLQGRTAAAEPSSSADVPQGAQPDVDPRTETEVTRAARLGQSKFRSDLLKRWNSKCALIGLDMPELLRASHIKPWCDSSDRERLDPDNGLLLAVHIDVLFDGGLISFADDGKMLVSAKLSSATCQALGIDRALSIKGLSGGNRRYLAMHRDVHFPAGGAIRADSVE